MNSRALFVVPLLVELWDQNIPKPMTLGRIGKEGSQFVIHRIWVISVQKLTIHSQCNHVVKLITTGEVHDLRFCSATTFFH